MRDEGAFFQHIIMMTLETTSSPVLRGWGEGGINFTPVPVAVYSPLVTAATADSNNENWHQQ